MTTFLLTPDCSTGKSSGSDWGLGLSSGSIGGGEATVTAAVSQVSLGKRWGGAPTAIPAWD